MKNYPIYIVVNQERGANYARNGSEYKITSKGLRFHVYRGVWFPSDCSLSEFRTALASGRITLKS